MMLITYLISIPLGIRKAVHDGEPFDTWTSGVLVIGYAMPGFLFAVLLLSCSPAARSSSGSRRAA